MAELKLNTSTSIIDFLKSQNKPSDFSSRESLYKSSGLEDRLGKYVSSGSQNIAFLKNLNTPKGTDAVTPKTVDTSSFTSEQLSAYNRTAALAPTPPRITDTSSLNTPVLLAHQVNGRWVIDEDTWKGNLPAPDYQIVTPQQAQEKLQENINNLNSEIGFYTAQHGANAKTVTLRQKDLAGLQQQVNKFANYAPPASSGLQYTTDPRTGNLITKENLANFIAPNAVTPTLTQAQLTAQNTAMGRTELNPAPAIPSTATPATNALAEVQSQTSATTTPFSTPTIGTSGITASQAAASIPQTPSADDILNSVLNSAGFQNFQQQQDLSKELDIGGAQAERQKLEAQTAADTKKFIDSIGRRGLFFSGETITGLQSLAESLASSKLGVDRKLAGQLLESDLKTKEQIIKQVGDVVKDAQKGRKEAVDALEKVGLTVIGNEIVPTLAAQAAERADSNAKLAAQREERLAKQAEFNQAATEERLRLAQEAADRATTALGLSIKKAAGGGVVTSGSLNITKESIGNAAKTLQDSKSILYDANGNPVGNKSVPSQWVDSNLYTKMYQEWTNQGGLGQDFVKAFPPSLYIDPNDKSLPTYLQNKPSNNVITISPATIEAALGGE